MKWCCFEDKWGKKRYAYVRVKEQQTISFDITAKYFFPSNMYYFCNYSNNAEQ